MSVNQHKENMQHFKAPTIENDLGRLNEEQIYKQQKFTHTANLHYDYVRRNGMPAGYAETIEVYKQAYEKNNAGPINFEDIYALDATISQTIWDNDVFSQIGIPTRTMTKPRFQLKDYLVQSEEWPRFTTQYRNPVFIRIKDSNAWSNGVGLHLGISIPFTEIRESQGALWGPREIMMQELAAKFGLQKSRRGFLGTSILNAYGDDGSDAADMGITGLFNYASNQTFEAGAGSDDDVTAQGDMEFTVRAAMTDLKKVYQAGKIVIVSTSGIASQMFLERDTYQQRLDSERVKEIMKIVTDSMGGSNMGTSWGGWYVTEQLYAGAPAVANQQMMVMKVAPTLINRHLVYPQQMLPMANKQYEADIQENMIFGDILQVKNVDTTNNAVPITIAADVTADSTGFIPDGVRIL